MTYSEEFVDLLLMDVPAQHETENGFMDILEINYKETAITRIYAYFLDKGNSSILGELFMGCLREIIFEKTKMSLELQTFRCEPEYRTNKGNSIDLVLLSEDNSEAIIIENKINAGLYNDLVDYYESIHAVKKIGVVLTLQRLPSSFAIPKEYINVTHLDWITRIVSKGLPLKLSPREYIYLNDFIKNMQTISISGEPNEAVRFYFEHTNRVLKAKATYEAAFKFIIEQLRITASQYSDNWESYGYSADYRQIWDTKNKALAYFTIDLKKILGTEPEVTVVIEIYKDAIQRVGDLRTKLRESGAYAKLNDREWTTAAFAHLGQLTYKLRKEDILDLSSFLLKKLNEDFRQAMDLVLFELKK